MKFLLLLLAAIVLCSCRTEKLSSSLQKKTATEVKKALHETFADIKANGFTAELKHLDNSTGFFWVPPRRSDPITYDSVSRILHLFSPGYRQIENIWDTIHVLPLNRKLASYTGKFHATYTDTSGKVTAFNMMEIGVAIKKNKKWVLINGQTSVVPKN